MERLGTFLDALRSSGAALCVVSLARQDMCVPYTLTVNTLTPTLSVVSLGEHVSIYKSILSHDHKDDLS